MIVDTSLIERLQPYGDLLLTGEFAFNSRVGEVAILPLPYNRIAVIQVMARRPGGIPDFDMFPNYVTAHARRAQQMEMLKPRVEELSKKLTPDMLIGPMREIAPMADVFLFNDETVKTPPDEDERILDSLVATTGPGEVSRPVRGVHGYYFLRVHTRSGPTMEQFERERKSYTEDYRERYRKELLEDLMAEARAFAEIEDLRPATQKLLSQR
jgi:hypothetical protein